MTTESYLKMIDYIKSFRELAPNWDSYDALPISQVAISNSIRWLEAIKDTNCRCWAFPHCCGGVQIELEKERFSFTIEFYPDESIYAYLLLERSSSEIETIWEWEGSIEKRNVRESYLQALGYEKYSYLDETLFWLESEKDNASI